MTGSMWVPIIVPIVALLALGSWLALVYYADAHPQTRHASAPQAGLAGGQAATDTVEGTTRQEVAPAASVASAASAVPRPADGTARDRAASSGATADSTTADSGAPGRRGA